MSGASVFFVLPAKSFNKFISAFRNKDNFSITINLENIIFFYDNKYLIHLQLLEF